MTTLFIEPSDVWLFRDGRPFSAGSDHRARSIFPPFPSVTAGMLRTSYLLTKEAHLPLYAKAIFGKGDEVEATSAEREAIISAYKDIGSPKSGDYGDLRIRGPYLATWDGNSLTRYYPAPADLFVNNDASNASKDICLIPEVRADATINTNLQGGITKPRLLWLPQRSDDEHKVEAASGWLSESEIAKYLTGKQAEVAKISLTPNEELFDYENRLGIALQPGSKSTVEGMLYTVDFIRTNWQHGKHIGIYLEVLTSGSSKDIAASWPDEGVVSIGGERRAGLYRKVDVTPDSSPTTAPKRKLKVYLSTPTYFQNGWYPANWSEYFSGNPQLVAAAISPTVTMGGFDLAHHRHKAAKRYVPAGSVYYLESDTEIEYNQKPITDEGGEIGFGQILIGEWQ